MSMEGQGEGQPSEGVVSIDDVAEALLDQEETAQDETEEGEEESEESEGEQGETESEEEEGEEEEEGDEPEFTIKHDGKDVTLKQSEILEMAQKGFDYSQKTMAVADERKAVVAERETVTTIKQQSEHVLNQQIQGLQALQALMQDELGAPPEISLAAENAHQYLVEKEWYEQRAGKLQQVQNYLQQTSQEAQRQRQAWIEVQADETYRALESTVPGWNDEMLNDLSKYAEGFGLNPRTAEGAFVNKGFWQVMTKAKAYDEMQAKKAEIKPKPKSAAKVAKPAAQNQTGKAAARAKHEAEFARNPSVELLARFL